MLTSQPSGHVVCRMQIVAKGKPVKICQAFMGFKLMAIQLSYQASYVLPRISKSRWFLNLIGSAPDCDWICPMLCSFWNQKISKPHYLVICQCGCCWRSQSSTEWLWWRCSCQHCFRLLTEFRAMNWKHSLAVKYWPRFKSVLY